jgi:hypothetical protein
MWRGNIFHGLLENILPCYKILCDVEKYFITSLNNFHVASQYTKNISWHGMEYVIRFFLAHLNRLACTCSFASIVDKNVRKFMTNKKQSNTKKKPIPPSISHHQLLNLCRLLLSTYHVTHHPIRLHCRNFITSTSYMWIINIPPRRQGILWLLFMSGWDQVMAYIGIIWYIP